MQRILTAIVAGGMLVTAALAATKDPYQDACAQGKQEFNRLQYGAAAQWYQQALQAATNDSQRALALKEMAGCDCRAGMYEAALKEARECLALLAVTPDIQAQCWETIGDSLAGKKQYGEALEAYVKMRDIQGVDATIPARAQSKLGDMYYAMGAYGPARQAYEEAVKNSKVAAFHLRGAWVKIGDCLMAEKKYAEARQAYERVATAPTTGTDEKDRAAAQAGIGNAYYEAGDYPAACKAYLALVGKPYVPQMVQVVERLDTIFRMQLNKADALLAAGKFAEARAEYEKVLTMEQVEEHHQASALLGMGDCLAGEKKYAEARAAYEKVLGLKGAYWPDRGRAQMGIARCYVAEGKKAEARQAWEAVLKIKNVAAADIENARQ